mmetsp:Transcript_55542/g.118114  ORF Transcript_55542/g.118114 Transcript_55542/m.118114 type:complete len:115 (+) Transcript_55542:1424-1768(+)
MSSSSESEYESSDPGELTAERIKERIAELRNNKRATKEWIKRVRKLAHGAVDRHHADLLDDTMDVIEEDARAWDEEITAMLCMLRKVNTTNRMSLDDLGRSRSRKLINRFNPNH